jgi:hypothetical protein
MKSLSVGEKRLDQGPPSYWPLSEASRDRRFSMLASFGYRTKKNFSALALPAPKDLAKESRTRGRNQVDHPWL